ncbi:HU family DNA-binding protein [Pseudonocardia acaciae]|uniref:HU family DNA-binding protein n=1 Tax=Pseudonocardia acaciae TaxID=551276 RepID=UPI0007E8D68F|nr:HU family DNA-binding protein [Pseudonocardia acaciae]
MNKAELVTALAEHLDGDRRTATAAVDGLLDVIVRTVQAGDSVSLTGFGVFESRQRAARSGRNPRTGQVIQVPAATVPAFRPGAMFRDVVSGARDLGDGPVRSARSVSRPRSRPVPASAGSAGDGEVSKASSSVAVAEKPAKAGGKGKAAKASKDGKAGKDGAKGGKSAKAAAGKDGKGGKKKGKK